MRTAAVSLTVAATMLAAIRVAPVASIQHAAIEWPTDGNDKGGRRFSPATEIRRDNLDRLEVAWTYRTGMVPGPPGKSQSTPVYVGGRLYVTNTLGRVIALDPETGNEFWSFDPRVDPDGNYPERWSRSM